jgi:hypothetical protein
MHALFCELEEHKFKNYSEKKKVEENYSPGNVE